MLVNCGRPKLKNHWNRWNRCVLIILMVTSVGASVAAKDRNPVSCPAYKTCTECTGANCDWSVWGQMCGGHGSGTTGNSTVSDRSSCPLFSVAYHPNTDQVSVTVTNDRTGLVQWLAGETDMQLVCMFDGEEHDAKAKKDRIVCDKITQSKGAWQTARRTGFLVVTYNYIRLRFDNTSDHYVRPTAKKSPAPHRHCDWRDDKHVYYCDWRVEDCQWCSLPNTCCDVRKLFDLEYSAIPSEGTKVDEGCDAIRIEGATYEELEGKTRVHVTVRDHRILLEVGCKTNTTSFHVTVAGRQCHDVSTFADDVIACTLVGPRPQENAGGVTVKYLKDSKAMWMFQKRRLSYVDVRKQLITEAVTAKTTNAVTGTNANVAVTATKLTATATKLTVTAKNVPVKAKKLTVTAVTPVTAKKLTVTAKDVPVTTKDVPVTTKDVTVTTKYVPVTAMKLTVTTTDVPVTTTDVPVTTTDVPVTTTDVPVTTTDVPVTTTDVPVTTTGVTVTAMDVPVTTEDVTVTTMDVPVTTEDVTVTTMDVPVTTEDVTVTTMDVPVTTEDVTVMTNSTTNLTVTTDAPTNMAVSMDTIMTNVSTVMTDDKRTDSGQMSTVAAVFMYVMIVAVLIAAFLYLKTRKGTYHMLIRRNRRRQNVIKIRPISQQCPPDQSSDSDCRIDKRTKMERAVLL